MIVLHQLWLGLVWAHDNPLTVIAVASYLEMFCSNLSARTGWRWAAVANNILAALPSVSPTRLAMSASKTAPKE